MTNWSFLFLVAICWCMLGSCEEHQSSEDKYDRYSLFRLTPLHDWHFNIIEELSHNNEDVEILKRSYKLNGTTDLLVPPEKIHGIRRVASEVGLAFDEKVQYGRAFDHVERNFRRQYAKTFNLFGYNSHGTINNYLDLLAQQYPNMITVESLGTSYEHRTIKMAKISSNPLAQNPIIFIDAGIHAREWVAPAMAMYLINRLVTDPNASADLQGVDWYILPLVNPDGYEYTRASRSHRMWRKTRSQHSRCYGVDGNRNYGFKWGVSGVSTNPCNGETYAGPKPFSEPETRIVKDVMLTHKERIKVYVSLHSYGQYLVYPWGYTGDLLPKSWKKLDNLAREVSKNVVAAGGKPFHVTSAGQWYPAAGGSDDFAFGAVGVPYSYTMELTDGYEFVFPESKLRTTLPPFYAGFRVFGNQVRKEFSPVVLKAHDDSQSPPEYDDSESVDVGKDTEADVISFLANL